MVQEFLAKLKFKSWFCEHHHLPTMYHNWEEESKCHFILYCLIPGLVLLTWFYKIRLYLFSWNSCFSWEKKDVESIKFYSMEKRKGNKCSKHFVLIIGFRQTSLIKDSPSFTCTFLMQQLTTQLLISYSRNKKIM